MTGPGRCDSSYGKFWQAELGRLFWGRWCQAREEWHEVREDSQRPVSDLMGSGRRWREGAKFSLKAWSQSEVSWNGELTRRTTPGILSREYLVLTVNHRAITLYRKSAVATTLSLLLQPVNKQKLILVYYNLGWSFMVLAIILICDPGTQQHCYSVVCWAEKHKLVRL